MSGNADDDNVFLEEGSDLAIIREIYSNSNGAHELFEIELERALEKGVDTIVIEPRRLGEETARWIMIGNCLRKTALLSGFGSVASSLAWPDKPSVYLPLTTISLLSTGVHLSWQFDSCYNYKVESDPNKLSIRSGNSDSPTPVVLIKRKLGEIRRNNILHAAISLIALALSAWKLFKCSKFTVI